MNKFSFENINLLLTDTKHLYVRAVDGNDNNAGSIARPLATLVEARNRIPYIVHSNIVIHVGLHTGAGYELPTFGPHLLNANIGVIGDGAGVGDGKTEIIASTSTLAGTTREYIISSGLSDTEYGGFGELYSATIEILSGAAIGERRHVAYNTTDRIYPLAPFYNTVAEGDLYRIVVPAIRCVVPYSGAANSRMNVVNVGGCEPYRNFDQQGYKIVFADMELVTNNSYFSAINSSIAFFNVLSSSYFWLTGSNIKMFAGTEANYPGGGTRDGVQCTVDLFGAPNIYAWYSLGVGSRWDDDDSEMSVTGTACSFHGFATAGDLWYRGESVIRLDGVACQGNGIRVGQKASLSLSKTSTLYGLSGSPIFRVGGPRAARGISADENAQVSIYSAVSNGILIRSAYDVLLANKLDSRINVSCDAVDGIELECVNASPQNYAAIRVDGGVVKLSGSSLPSAINNTHGFKLGTSGVFHDLDELASGDIIYDVLYGKILRV